METYESSGVIEEKSEAAKKDGDKYWKFKIDGKTYSLWDYDKGINCHVGDEVRITYTQKESEFKGKKVVYRNISEILLLRCCLEEVIGDSNSNHEEQIKNQPDPLAKQGLNKNHADVIKKGVPANLQAKANNYNASKETQDRITLGMAANNSATLIAPMMAQGVEVSDDGQVKTGWAECWEPVYKSLVKRLFTIYKELQDEKIGGN